MKKRLLTLLGVFCILTTFTIPASASYSIWNGRLSGGIGDYNQGNYREYWIDSDLNTDMVTKGIDGWNHSTSYSGIFSKINFQETSDRPSSVMDYYSSDLEDYTLGETYYYRSNGSSASKSVENWAYCRVYINTSSTAMGNKALTNFNYVRTSAHEMGHVLGFNECNSEKDSIMCQSKYSNNNYNYPIAADIKKLNTMY